MKLKKAITKWPRNFIQINTKLLTHQRNLMKSISFLQLFKINFRAYEILTNSKEKMIYDSVSHNSS
jgi:hypothetical protein